jgi:mono/diheme cytochrome c family protein
MAVSCQNSSINRKVEVNLINSLPPKVGYDVYSEYCFTCHQAEGLGVPGMYPPLSPGSWVGKDSKELIAIMMKGLSGKIEVNGEFYKKFMPSQTKLTNEEIANVLTYIRSSFGNNFEPVTIDVVAKIRSGH